MPIPTDELQKQFQPVSASLKQAEDARKESHAAAASWRAQWQPLERAFDRAAGIDEIDGESDEEFYARWLPEWEVLAERLHSAGVKSLARLVRTETPGELLAASTLQSLMEKQDLADVRQHFAESHRRLVAIGCSAQVNYYLSTLKEAVRRKLMGLPHEARRRTRASRDEQLELQSVLRIEREPDGTYVIHGNRPWSNTPRFVPCPAKNDDWVISSTAAALEGIKGHTLANNRSGRDLARCGEVFLDRCGRVVWKPGPNAHVHYLRRSLRPRVVPARNAHRVH